MNKIDENSESAYINWETDENGKIKSKYRGTSSITGTVNKECVKIGTKIILDENSAWVIAKAPDNTEINVKQPKEISKVIMKINTERS